MKLGWILLGHVNYPTKSYRCHVIIGTTGDISKYWKIEDLTMPLTSALSKKEQNCELLYQATTHRQDDESYVVALPMKENYKTLLGNDKNKAIGQFNQLERKINNNTSFAYSYKKIVKEYQELGHMISAPAPNNNLQYFMPHHGIQKNDSTTTKLRVVLNASCKTSSGLSLNDVMECGPNLQGDLQALILNWRKYRYVMTSDIEKVYRTIFVRKADQSLQSIVWRDSPNQPLQHFQLTTVTYGTKAAPYLAMRTLKQFTMEEGEKYPLVVQALQTNFYMNDYLGGCDDILEAKKLQRQRISLLKCANMNLRKWSSNEPRQLEDLPKEFREMNFEFKFTQTRKTLVLVWDPITDAFKFKNVYAEEGVPTTQITAVAGEPVYLPCDISMQDEEDAVLLVLWYKEDMGTPIYSVDARERDFGVAERWSDESVFASRAYFLPQKRPAELGVDRVRPSDQGMYRCRVDFKMAQTRNSKVNLTVIVPPSKLVITDDKGDIKQAIVGPFVEGDTFTLKCDVIGARPRPWVKWFRDEIETDTPSTPLPNNGVRGIIRVGPLTRADVRAALTCRASNHARAHPIETTLTLDMNFPPLTVHILGSNQPLSASRRYDLLCQSSGSRPPASITWWKNGHRINNAKETLSTDGNTTTSTVSLQLTKSDAGAKLACRASNPQMPSVPPLEHDWVLDIQYVPETVVRLGTNLDPRNIREVSDVYFDCIIRAHPYVYKVEWRHNGKTLQHNVGHGIIISNQSLVLQGVGRRTAGNYTCVGFNAEGDGESKPFLLDVLYAPTCRSTQQRVHGVAKQERANISCHVDANPPEVSFRWTFNNTAHNNEVSQSYVSKTGTSSIVTYTPHNEMDYGTLLCWAHNKIGKQRVPCVYHIIAAGRPDQVHNCSVVNASLTSFGVRCSEGFNGGLPQSFLLEVREPLTQTFATGTGTAPAGARLLQLGGKGISMQISLCNRSGHCSSRRTTVKTRLQREIVSNVSSAVPRFNAIGLSPGRTYAASILAYNAKGRGDPYPLRASTLRPPEKHHVHDKSLDLPRTAFQMSGAMSAAVGGGGIVMVAIVLFMIAVKHRCAKRKPRSAPPTSSQPASPDKLREKDDSESDDRNPDIIPSDRDSDQMQLDYYRQQQVSTISPPPGSRVRGSVAGVRGGLPAYCALRTAPMHGECDNVNSGIPPPARFASGACTLPRNTALNPGDSRCIPLQHLRTLPRPLPAPSPTPRVPPRDTPL